jgi:hypothetical protein
MAMPVNGEGNGKGWQDGLQQQLEWRATKMGMPTAMKRAMATDVNNMRNG